MAIKIFFDLIKFKIKLVKYLSRHHKTPLKFLLWVDDIIRIFAMTILFVLFSRILNLNPIFSTIFFILGLIIDIEDFVQNKGIGKFEL